MEYERADADYEAFFELASVVLEREARSLPRNALDRLSSLECSWHPNGFAVFHINDDPELGKLRLHIWPDAKRITRPDTAPIHTHAWHLCSRILIGTYTETLYEKSGPESIEAREYYLGVIDYPADKDFFAASGKTFLKSMTTTQTAPGEFHTVPAGVPHETHIAEGAFVATLLITSPDVTNEVKMYSPEELPDSTYNRPALTLNQKMELLDRLEQELKALAVG